jgi:hypothetical protein
MKKIVAQIEGLIDEGENPAGIIGKF